MAKIPGVVRAGLCIALGVLALLEPARADKATDSLRATYPGTIILDVDASDVDRRIFRVRETIPVQPGPLTLFYPEWIPGQHSPQSARIWLFVGLKITGGGREITWRRDPGNVFAFSLEVPRNVTELQAEFQFLSPMQATQGQVVIAPDLLTLTWNQVLLYPAGFRADGIRVRPSVKLPSGWEFASSLEVAAKSVEMVQFVPTSLAELVDSPVSAGRNVRRIELDPGSAAPVTLSVFADAVGSLAAEPDHLAAFRAMVQQTYKVFGVPNFRRFELMLMLHDQISNASAFGLEHQSSTEIPRSSGFFTRWKALPQDRPVVPHEFVHVWIGKKHRPGDLDTPHYNVAMKNSLLWSYEGETEYWAYVLAARSGMLSKEQVLGAFARNAASIDQRPGRSWRNFQDTTNEPIMRLDRAREWYSWQRGVDYYGEGVFLWMEADARIRELTGDKRSMNDFARDFHGGKAATPGVVTYDSEDVVKALNQVAPYDWRAFIQERLESKTRRNATEALRAAGWRVVYKEKPNEFAEAADRESGVADFFYSIGFGVGRGDAVTSVVWEGPAFQAGIAGPCTLLAVNGRAYKADLLRSAITAAKESGAPISLLIKSGDLYKTVSLSYRDGLRYPHLERIPEVPDRLSGILEPLP